MYTYITGIAYILFSPIAYYRWLGRFIVLDSFWVMYTGYRLTYKFNLEEDSAAQQGAMHIFSQQKHALYIVFGVSYLLRLILTLVFVIRSSNGWVILFNINFYYVVLLVDIALVLLLSRLLCYYCNYYSSTSGLRCPCMGRQKI